MTPEKPPSSKISQNPRDRDEYLRQLREAAAAFENERGEKLRLHIVGSLLAVNNYLDLTLPPNENRNVLRPLTFLLQALLDLYRGNTHPSLKAVRLNHRRPCSLEILGFKAECLILLALLRHEGLPKDHASHLVVDHYASAANVLGLGLSVKRLRSWERELRHSRTVSDGNLTRLCHRYDEMFAKISKRWASTEG